jgi:hypothetical protein
MSRTNGNYDTVLGERVEGKPRLDFLIPFAEAERAIPSSRESSRGSGTGRDLSGTGGGLRVVVPE